VSQELLKYGVGYDEAFSSSIQQRKQDTKALFYRLLHHLVEYERERVGQQNGDGLAKAADISVSAVFLEF